MNFMKKQTAGTFATVITLFFALISYIIYLVNIGMDGYFKNAKVPAATRPAVTAIVLLCFVLILTQLKFNGIVNRIIIFITDLMRMAVPALSIATICALIFSRATGLAFIYFSNEEVLLEVQTAANIASSQWTIANMIFWGITAIVGIVASFLTIKKEEE